MWIASTRLWISNAPADFTLLAPIQPAWYGDNMDTLPATIDPIAEIAELLIEEAEASLATPPTDDQ